jgi:glutamate racemase
VDSEQVRALLASYIEPMLAAGADTLVLGCTHYPFFDAVIRDIVDERVMLIDTSVAIARQLERVLGANGLRAAAGTNSVPSPRLCSTNDGAHLLQLASRLLGLGGPVERVDIPLRDTPAQEPRAA